MLRRCVLPLACAALLSGFLLAPPVLRILGHRTSVWVKVTATCSWGELPEAAIDAGPPANPLRVPVIWEPHGSSNFVAVRPAGGSTDWEVQLVSLAADAHELPLESVRFDAGWERELDAGGNPAMGLADATGALLQVPVFPSELDVALRAKAAEKHVLVSWRGEEHSVRLRSNAPTRLRLGSPGLHAGWAILPPEPLLVRGISIVAPTSDFTLRSIELLRRDGPSVLVRNVGGDALSRTCGLVDGKLLCAVPFADGIRVNGASFSWRVVLTSILAAASFAILGGLCMLALGLKALVRWCWAASAGEDPRQAMGRGRNRAAAAVAVVTIASALFHFLYVTRVPFMLTNDSGAYLVGAHRLASGSGWSALPSFRTPGYPLFLATLLRFFPTRPEAVFFAQHALLAALGPITTLGTLRFLRWRGAALAGLLAGVGPMMAPTGNLVWTEALFLVLMASGVLLLLNASRSRHRLFVLFAAGALMGASILVRPPALVVLAASLGGLSLIHLVALDGRPKHSRLALELAFVLAGVGSVIGPWMHEIKERFGVWKLTTVSDDLLAQRAPGPSAGFAAFPPMGYDEFASYAFALWVGRAGDDLLANAPFREFVRRFPRQPGFWWQSNYLAKEFLNDARYPMEVVRESMRMRPLEYLQNARVAFLFDCCGVQPGPGPYYSFNDVADASKMFRQARTSSRTVRDPPDSREFIASVVRATERDVGASLARDAVLAISQRAQRAYPLLVLLATLAALLMLASPRLFPLAVLWLCWAALLITLSVFGMAVDRYIWPMEPLLLILAAGLVPAAVDAAPVLRRASRAFPRRVHGTRDLR